MAEAAWHSRSPSPTPCQAPASRASGWSPCGHGHRPALCNEKFLPATCTGRTHARLSFPKCSCRVVQRVLAWKLPFWHIAPLSVQGLIGCNDGASATGWPCTVGGQLLYICRPPMELACGPGSCLPVSIKAGTHLHSKKHDTGPPSTGFPMPPRPHLLTIIGLEVEQVVGAQVATPARRAAPQNRLPTAISICSAP